jgi:hypothetical protein
MLEGCKILIKETKNQESIGVNEPFDVDSAIEIRPVNGNSKEWKMFLRQDPKKCYEKCGEKDRNIYINHAKRVIKEYKQDNSDQLNSSKEDEKKEYTPIQNIDECLKQFEKSTSQCGFYVCKSPYCIEKTDRYYAAVRCTGERVITVSPRDHYNNENWMKIIQISQHRRVYSAVHSSLISVAIFGIFSYSKRILGKISVN